MSRSLADAHWSLFVYRNIARHWHSLWCRWAPSGELKTKFCAERIFTPLADAAGTKMQVIYHYQDERGTVSTGPQCGPWEITEAHSRADGMAHPSSPDSMTTLMLPNGPSAWCMKALPSGAAGPCAVEMFLHHGDSQRVSFGVIHGPDGTLQQLSLIREHTRGPWPQPDWSDSDVATPTTAAELQAVLAAGAGTPIAALGRGYTISAGLEQQPVLEVPFGDTRVSKVTDSDSALLCAEKTCALVAPSHLVDPAFIGGRRVGTLMHPGDGFLPDGSAGWCSAAAWWPTPTVLYTIEARWGAKGELEGVRWLEFRG